MLERMKLGKRTKYKTRLGEVAVQTLPPLIHANGLSTKPIQALLKLKLARGFPYYNIQPERTQMEQ